MDSESEDNPRKLINVKIRDFYVLDQREQLGTFKLHNFNPMVEDANGKFIPFPGVLAVRPVPRPAALLYAREAMGNGAGGIWTATKFAPPAGSANPQDVFAARRVAAVKNAPFQRFCLRRRHADSAECAPAGLRTMCIFADGACINNGSTTVAPQAGCGFVFHRAQGGTVGFPLEKEGPDGRVRAHTSNRAELRAVIGALEFRSWWGEGWERIVVVTDSTYVAGGATEWMRTWAGRKWVKSAGSKVQNQDLWELLSAKIGGYAEGGCEISFWSVPRKYNEEADGAASAAAAREGPQSYQKQTGILV